MPNDEKLYNYEVTKESFNVNPCLPIHKEKKKLNKYIDSEDNKIYYYEMINDIPKIYIKQPLLNSFIELSLNNNLYPKIVKKILNSLENKIKGGKNTLALVLQNSALNLVNIY